MAGGGRALKGLWVAEDSHDHLSSGHYEEIIAMWEQHDNAEENNKLKTLKRIENSFIGDNTESCQIQGK